MVELGSLLAGLFLAITAWCAPKWTREHISERMNAFLLGMIPLMAGASVFLVRWVYSSYAVFKQEKNARAVLEERLKPKLTVEYKEDGQCNLAANSGIPDTPFPNAAHFRVWLHLHGVETVRNLIATVKAIRKDGGPVVLSEPVRLRFRNAENYSDVLKQMNPGTQELLDICRMDNGKLSLALATGSNSFNFYCCDEPDHTYEIDVYVGSSSPRIDFTFVCPWTGDMTTTKPLVTQLSSGPYKEASPHLPIS